MAGQTPFLGQELDTAHREFFRFYHLKMVSHSTAKDQTTLEFRPGGPFADNVMVLITVDMRDGRVTLGRLVLDSSFVEHPVNGKYARDIAKYFLKWGPPGQSAAALAPVADELGRKLGQAAAGAREGQAYRAFHHATTSPLQLVAGEVIVTIDPTRDANNSQPIVALSLQQRRGVKEDGRTAAKKSSGPELALVCDTAPGGDATECTVRPAK